jgi:hypothetical protein
MGHGTEGCSHLMPAHQSSYCIMARVRAGPDRRGARADATSASCQPDRTSHGIDSFAVI